MRDEIETRLWVEHGAQFAADIAKALKWVLRTFCTITAIQYRAPWVSASDKPC